jgi:C4-type Zn-finger protein
MRSRYATISIPEVQLEIPATAAGAVITSAEGLLMRVADDLDYDQACMHAHVNVYMDWCCMYVCVYV